VGKIIALIAEEGDDITNLEAPKEEPKPVKQGSAPSTKSETASPPRPPSSPSSSFQGYKSIKHSRPLFPSVSRLLLENQVADPERITGTGIRGMLTKGDVLAYLGKASSPTGTYKEPEKKASEVPKKVEEKVSITVL